ncbi:hypothetical protein NL676_038358 [Syzygium grande]|nr:hypothetical protein NL676_038358 [Syzygium grande]
MTILLLQHFDPDRPSERAVRRRSTQLHWIPEFPSGSTVSKKVSPLLYRPFLTSMGCRMESIAMRSYCLECVCLMVHDVRSSLTTQPTESKLREMSAVLKDLESSQIKVDWLRQVLERLSKSGELITQCDAIKVEKAKCDRVFETTKKKLERHLEDLAEKEQAVADAKARVAKTQDRLRQIELESSKLEESVASLQSQIKSGRIGSLLDELV